MIITDFLWCIVTYDLAHLYPFFCQYLVKYNKEHSLFNINCFFKNIIKTPLSILGDMPCEELLVIMIDVLDECDDLRYDLSTKDDYEDLLYTLKY